MKSSTNFITVDVDEKAINFTSYSFSCLIHVGIKIFVIRNIAVWGDPSSPAPLVSALDFKVILPEKIQIYILVLRYSDGNETIVFSLHFAHGLNRPIEHGNNAEMQ